MVASGLVKSLARPEGNTTGVSLLSHELDGKRLEILIEAVSGLRQVAALANSNTTASSQLQVLQDAARAHNIELSIHRIARVEEIEPAIHAAKASGAAALNVLLSPILYVNREIVMQSRRGAAPASHLCIPRSQRRKRPYRLRPTSHLHLSRAINPAAHQALARRQARRSSGPAADQVRAGDQP